MSTQAPQEEQNGACFSSVAPSSEELWLPPNQMYTHGKGRPSSGLRKLQTLITPHLKVLRN